MIVDLFTIIKTEFVARKVGPEILEWITGSGKGFFCGEVLSSLCRGYKGFQAKQKEEPLITEVDLDVEPNPPFRDAKLERNLKMGKVKVEYRPNEDELYVNNRKVVPWRSEEQLSGRTIGGYDLLPKALASNPIPASLGDWFCKHVEFVPKRFQGYSWLFWGTEWSGHGGSRYIRCFFLLAGRGFCLYNWLNGCFSGSDLSLSLAPENPSEQITGQAS